MVGSFVFYTIFWVVAVTVGNVYATPEGDRKDAARSGFVWAVCSAAVVWFFVWAVVAW